MQTKVTIKLTKVTDVYHFIDVVKEFSSDIDLASKGNPKHMVDAKSVMGIFALDLSGKLDVILSNDDNELEKNKFISVMRQFQE